MLICVSASLAHYVIDRERRVNGDIKIIISSYREPESHFREIRMVASRFNLKEFDQKCLLRLEFFRVESRIATFAARE